MSKKKNNPKASILTTPSTLSKSFTAILFIALPILFFYVGLNYNSIFHSMSVKDSYDSKFQQAGSEENEQLEKLKKRGINPEIISIYTLDIPDIRWTFHDSQVYNLKSVYLMEDIADMGNFRDNNSIKGKNFLVFKLDLRNRSVSNVNTKTQMLVSRHIRVRTADGDLSPVAGEFTYLSAQEDGSIYTVFAVNPIDKFFTVLTGDLSNPRTVDLDFSSSLVEVKEGVFLLNEGYLPEYPIED